ncbi:MAG: hypothetical protein P9M12_01950 [Candidatus Aceula lacicola]|nr:hypothetical protein [Candidatus Aceula lacicola]
MVFFKTKKYVDITNLPAKTNHNREFKIKKVKPVFAIKRLKPSVRDKEAKSDSLAFMEKAQGFFDKLKSLKASRGAKGQESKPLKPSGKASLISSKEELVGEITHFFSKISVCVIKLKKNISVGDKIYIWGNGCRFVQKISSMQVDHQNVEKASRGQEIGLKTIKEVKVGAQVFR